MIMRWIQIDKEVVVLYAEERDGKIVPGRLTTLPVGVFKKLYGQQTHD